MPYPENQTINDVMPSIHDHFVRQILAEWPIAAAAIQSQQAFNHQALYEIQQLAIQRLKKHLENFGNTQAGANDASEEKDNHGNEQERQAIQFALAIYEREVGEIFGQYTSTTADEKDKKLFMAA